LGLNFDFFNYEKSGLLKLSHLISFNEISFLKKKKQWIN